MSLVSLVSGSESSLQTSIEDSVDLLKFDFKSDFHNVVIKPDLCYYWDHSTGQTTDPTLVGNLIDFLRSRIGSSLELSIVAADTSAAACRDLFRFLGYEKIAREKNVRLINLTEDNYEHTEVRVGNHSYTSRLPNVIKKADLLVNVPKIKLWPATKISCALKNVYEPTLFSKKSNHQHFLNEKIVAANKLLRSGLSLSDGTWVRGKHTRKLGLLMSSVDPVAIDSAAARIFGVNPKGIDHIVIAEKEGLGTTEFETVGESISHFAEIFPRRKMTDRIWSAIAAFGIAALRKTGHNA